MAGIYLHIPFCKQACTYCNFHFTTSLRYKDDLLQAMKQEIIAEKHYLGGEKVDTVYFGGGTPSILAIPDLKFLLSHLFQSYSIAKDAEITIEANPDDITKEKLQGWKKLGINRLSIGIQSFFEEELRWMNRAHNAQQAVSSLQLAISEFDNITMDLIYGSPLLTDEMWKHNVDTAISLGVPHLSCYALTVEDKTRLQKNIALKKSVDVDDEIQARQFLKLMQWLRAGDYEHYEVSNFAKPGFRSRHNSSYWKGVRYLGIGPSAHSFNGDERRWNIAHNNVYVKKMMEGLPKREVEILSNSQKLNEAIMVSLRTREGLDLNKIQQRFGMKEKERIENLLAKFVNTGLIRLNHPYAQLTDEGILRADGIAADLFT